MTEASVFTDKAGIIQSLDEAAAVLLNFSGRHAALHPRRLAVFFVEGRVELLRDLDEVNLGRSPIARVAVLQPLERRPVRVTVRVTEDDRGVRWVLRRDDTHVHDRRASRPARQRKTSSRKER